MMGSVSTEPPGITPPAASAEAATGANRPLCATGLTVVRRRDPGAAPAPGACENVVALDRLPLNLDEGFGRLNLRGPGASKGRWTPSFPQGPRTGPLAWDSRTLPGNHEKEIYVDPAFAGSGSTPLGLKPFSVNGGVLSIAAGPTPARAKPWLWGFAYTSGLLTTHESFSQTYGYYEVSAKLPRGRGLWPAFWLLQTGGGWPPEIDIMEQLGGSAIHQTLHTTIDGKPAKVGFQTDVPGNARGFHRYGLLWTPKRLVWFIDRRQTASIAATADLNKPMYLLMNLAIGGDWPGDPDPRQRWPAVLKIDQVRVYGWPARAGP
jgi:beta-glucanase (GH16 family)